MLARLATPLLLITALSACGSSSGSQAGAAPSASSATPSSSVPSSPSAMPSSSVPSSPLATLSTGSGERTCDRQKVPGHEARDVRVSGLDCETARAVVLDAVGKGRTAYDSQGLTCEPADAPDGQTDYRCRGDGGRLLLFRYGAA